MNRYSRTDKLQEGESEAKVGPTLCTDTFCRLDESGFQCVVLTNNYDNYDNDKFLPP